MIYLVALLALFFTACTPAPMRFTLFECEMPSQDTPKTQEAKDAPKEI